MLTLNNTKSLNHNCIINCIKYKIESSDRICPSCCVHVCCTWPSVLLYYLCVGDNTLISILSLTKGNWKGFFECFFLLCQKNLYDQYFIFTTFRWWAQCCPPSFLWADILQCCEQTSRRSNYQYSWMNRRRDFPLPPFLGEADPFEFSVCRGA